MALFGMFPWQTQTSGLFGNLEYTGPGGYERLSPEMEAQLALEARESAARGFRGGRTQGTADMSLFNDAGGIPPPTVTQQMMPSVPFQGGFAPPSAAPSMPPPINIPSLKVMEQPIGAPQSLMPTDISSRNRTPEQPQSMSPQAMPQPSGFGQHINAGLGSFAGAPTIGGALLGGLTGLITGQRNDAYGVSQQNQQLTTQALYQGLIANGMPAQQAAGIAMAAATNPEIAKAILPQALGPKEPPKTMEEVYARQAYDASRRAPGAAPAGTAPSNYQDWLVQKNAAEARGKQIGETQGKTQANLPVSLQRGQDVLGQINELLNHKGFDRIFGLVGAFPNIPGGDAAGAQARLNQVKGQAFLDAYDMLKGGGAITEVEGAKATAAKARLEAAQSPAEARIALQDFSAAVRTGMQKLRETAGQAPVTPPANNSGWAPVPNMPGYRIRERQ